MELIAKSTCESSNDPGRKVTRKRPQLGVGAADITSDITLEEEAHKGYDLHN